MRQILYYIKSHSTVEASKHQYMNHSAKVLDIMMSRGVSPIDHIASCDPTSCITPALSMCTDGAPLVQMVWSIIGSLDGVTLWIWQEPAHDPKDWAPPSPPVLRLIPPWSGSPAQATHWGSERFALASTMAKISSMGKALDEWAKDLAYQGSLHIKPSLSDPHAPSVGFHQSAG